MASVNTKRKPKSEIENNELYNTPDIALESFYDQYPAVFNGYNKYYDPCNGLGKISNFLKSIGKECITSDIVDYGCQDFVKDFIELDDLPEGIDCVIFNPPFTLTEAFIDKFYELAAKGNRNISLLMFNRMTTIESNSRGKKFKDFTWTMENMWQFSFRVSCTKGLKEETTANSVAYSWFELIHSDLEYKYAPSLWWITK